MSFVANRRSSELGLFVLRISAGNDHLAGVDVMDQRVFVKAVIHVVEKIANGARRADAIELDRDRARAGFNLQNGLFQVHILGRRHGGSGRRGSRFVATGRHRFRGRAVAADDPPGSKQCKNANARPKLSNVHACKTLGIRHLRRLQLFRTKSKRCAARQQCQPSKALPNLAKHTAIFGLARNSWQHLTKSFAIPNEHFIAFPAVWG